MPFGRPGRLLLLVLLFVLISGVDAVADPVRCTCRDGQACYHYLNAPVTPPDDPCSCPFCREHPGKCPKIPLEGWDPTCYRNRKMECFLRRHASSWDIVCSEQLKGKCDCRNPHPEWCPSCGSKHHEWNRMDREELSELVLLERKQLGPRSKFIMMRSEHFFLVTDIPRLKILTQERSPRIMKMHEIAHVFMQRAELAYNDFVEVFGDRVILDRPCAIYLMHKERTKEAIAEIGFGHSAPERFIGEAKRIMGGRAKNGLAISYQKYDTDYWLHHMMRHLLGHILYSCWIKVDPRNQYFPRWTYAGTGHWLARLPKNLREMANFCAGEGVQVRHSGEKWREDLLRFAISAKSHPIQRIFDINSIGGIDLESHQRCWSMFDLFLAEDRERFVAFLAELREGTDHRNALKDTMGMTPEEFEQRWKDRILGRRKSLAPTVEELDAKDPSRPGAAVRASLRQETDPQTLAAKIRSLKKVDDPLTAATLVSLLSRESDRVRELVVLVLGRTTAPAVSEWLRTEGLTGSSGLSRAYVARILADLADEEAGDALQSRLSDGFWMVRAQAARAMGSTLHEPGLRGLEKLVKDRSSKVRIAAMDAIAKFGRRAGFAWLAVSTQLNASQWQVRSAAAECLGYLGEMKAAEPLIKRMETEAGRIRVDIRTALKRLTRDDLGNNPKYWRDWWEKEKERHGGNVPPPDEATEPPAGDHNYGPGPTYYGLRVFSQAVGYVLDTSSSMIYRIKLDPAWLKRNRREYPGDATKFDLARSEIAVSLASLNPRTRINLYFFRSAASSWKSRPVPASPNNINSAVGRLKAERPSVDFSSGQRRTNYIDVFRLVLEMKKDSVPSGATGDTVDTLFFLTDGKPTVGDIVDPLLIRQWFREHNRYARMRLNIVTFGMLETNAEFLQPLAEENGGSFIQIPNVD